MNLNAIKCEIHKYQLIKFQIYYKCDVTNLINCFVCFWLHVSSSCIFKKINRWVYSLDSRPSLLKDRVNELLLVVFLVWCMAAFVHRCFKTILAYRSRKNGNEVFHLTNGLAQITIALILPIRIFLRIKFMLPYLFITFKKERKKNGKMNHQKIAFDKVNIAHCPNIHINRMTYFIGLCLNWLFFSNRVVRFLRVNASKCEQTSI